MSLSYEILLCILFMTIEYSQSVHSIVRNPDFIVEDDRRESNEESIFCENNTKEKHKTQIPFTAYLHFLLSVPIYITVFEFRIHDRLCVVQAVISGKHVADGDCDQVVISVVEAEQLEADQQRGDWAVCHAAENRNHADCGT